MPKMSATEADPVAGGRLPVGPASGSRITVYKPSRAYRLAMSAEGGIRAVFPNTLDRNDKIDAVGSIDVPDEGARDSFRASGQGFRAQGPLPGLAPDDALIRRVEITPYIAG